MRKTHGIAYNLVFNFDDFYSRFALSVSFSNTFHFFKAFFFLADHKVSELSC